MPATGLPGVQLPHILGSDIAGEVAECGEYVTDLKLGTRVLLAPMVFCNHFASSATPAGIISAGNSPCSAMAWMAATASSSPSRA